MLSSQDSRFGVLAYRLMICGILVQAAALQGASLTLQVSTEAAPPGGSAQFKVSVASPALIATGNISIDFDPSMFGNVASVTVFSATGDQIGYANVKGRHIDARFSSTSGGIGQLSGLPVLVVSIPVLAAATLGAADQVIVDAAVDPTGVGWTDPDGNPYAVRVNPGKFTVGGSLSVTSVTPGGGLLPQGAVIAIGGTGFQPATSISIDGVVISSVQYISPQQMNLTLGGPAELTGKRVHVANATDAPVDYFSALPSASSSPPSGFSTIAGVHPILPLATYTNIEMFTYLDHPPSPVGYAFLNPGVTPATVSFEGALLYPNTTPITLLAEAITIPAGTLYLLDMGSLLTAVRNPEAALWITASAPIRMVIYSQPAFGGIPTGPPVVSNPPPRPNSPAPPLQFQIPVSPLGVSWSWQQGTAQPVPTILELSGTLDFAVSIPAAAAAWIGVTPRGGTALATVTLTPNLSGLSPGTYSAALSVTPVLPPSLATYPTKPTTITVSVTVSPAPMMNASAPATPAISNTGNLIGPLSLSFVLTAGSGPPAAPQVVNVGSGDTFSASTQSGGDWMSTALFVNAYQTIIQVNASAVGLSPGTYQGTITIKSGTVSTAQIAVTLTVLPIPPAQNALTATPAAVSLSVPNGTSMQTVMHTIMLDSAEAPVLFKLTAFGSNLLQPIYVNSDLPGADGQVATPATISFGVDASLLVPGTYHEKFVLTWATGSLTIPVTLSVTASASQPPIIAAVVNAASVTVGALAPGEIMAIFGTGIGPAPTGLALDASGKVATNLGGAQVLINGVPAPLIYVSATQVNAVIPYQVGTQGGASLQIVSGGVRSGVWQIPLAPAAPAIFSIGSSGVGQAAVLNQDNSVNGPSSRATRGTLIQIYATGGGLTSPPGVTGSIAGSNTRSTVLPTAVTVGGQSAAVQYAGSAPNAVDGLLQVNVVVPLGVNPGPAVPISIAIGGATSQNGVSIAVQ
jgi:uncharacterized protein (TIGR03437 family)